MYLNRLRQRWADGTAKWRLLWLVYFAGALAGCATVCRPPEVRAADRGVVLECVKHGGWAECLVSTKDGDVKVEYKECR